MAPQTAIILFAGWLIGAIPLTTLPHERSMRLALLLAFSVEAAFLCIYYLAAK